MPGASSPGRGGCRAGDQDGGSAGDPRRDASHGHGRADGGESLSPRPPPAGQVRHNPHITSSSQSLTNRSVLATDMLYIIITLGNYNASKKLILNGCFLKLYIVYEITTGQSEKSLILAMTIRTKSILLPSRAL